MGTLGELYSLCFMLDKYPDRVDKLTLMASIGTSFNDYTLFAQNLQGKLDAESQKKIQELRQNPNATPLDYHKVFLPYYFYSQDNIENMTKTDINVTVNRAIIQDIYTRFNFVGKEHKFQMPIQILQGEADLLKATTLRERFSDFPNTTVIEVKEAGHWLFVENPKELKRLIKMFH